MTYMFLLCLMTINPSWGFVPPRYIYIHAHNAMYQNPTAVSTRIITYSSAAATERNEGRNNIKEKQKRSQDFFSEKNNKSDHAAATSRYLAVLALMKQTKTKNCSASTVLESNKYFSYLNDRRDRAFAKLLVTTCERRRGQIELVLNDCIKKQRKNVRIFCLAYVHACIFWEGK